MNWLVTLPLARNVLFGMPIIICTWIVCFLKENFRGHGIGEAMVNKMVDYAKVVNANHIEWQTPVFNTRAIKFYNRIGATSKEKIRFTLNYKTN